MSIVVIGGGLAGATAVTTLRDLGYHGPLTLIGAELHVPYERPPLSKGILLGTSTFADACVHDLDWYAAHDVDLLLGSWVESIDRERRTVHLGSAGGSGNLGHVGSSGHSRQVGDDTLPYNTLLLAMGADPRRLAWVDEVGRPVHTLRTIEDSLRLRDALQPGARVRIIGAGWIGLEVAAAARLAGAEVTVFEVAVLPLVRVLGPEVAEVFAQLHRHHGVDLRLGVAVTPEDLADSDAIVVGIGAIPTTDLAEAAGLAVDNGILVDSQLRTSDPHIYAVGDVANHDHPVLGRRIRVEHWDTSVEQAKVAAGNILGAGEDYARLPYFFTDQYDLGMEYFGSVGPDGYDRVEIEGADTVLAGGAFRAFWYRGDRVVAAMHANDWDASDAVRERVTG